MSDTNTQTTFCRICECTCGLEVKTENGKVIDIQPDTKHIATEGFSCVKGLKQHEMYQSSDRLKYPMKKGKDGHEPVSWKKAMEEMGGKLRKIRKEHGPDAIAMYVGTAAGFSVLHPTFAQGFMTGIGSKSMYSSSTQDCSNKFAVAQHMYGFSFTQPFPDLEHINCLIIVGANPVISKWSFLQVPNPIKKLRAIEARGGSVFVVDPRKTETAKIAGEHLFIQPGTDVFFYLSFLHEFSEQDGIDHRRVEQHMSGVNKVLELAAQWPATRTESVTGISAEKLKQLVRTYLNADGAALYCSTGVNMGGNGALSFWIQEVINAVSGNLDRQGGTLVAKGIMDFLKFGAKNGLLMRGDRSRIGNLPSVNDGFPGGVLADEILTPGKGQIKALIVTGGNPLITMANSGRLRDAFRQLELLICLDILPGETCTEAHYQLPCTDPLQRADLPFVFPLMLGLQMKPYIQATHAVSDPVGEQRDEASIYLDLAKHAGIDLFGSSIAQKFLQVVAKIHSWRKGHSFLTLPQEFLLDLLLRVNGQKGFKKLLKYHHGLARPGHRPGSFLSQRVFTPDKKVALAPNILLDQSQKLDEDFNDFLNRKGQFRLITKRAVTTHNSWTHNLERMVANGRHTNFLYLHSGDGEKLDLKENDLADVRSETGSVRIPVKYLDELMPGTVALPHGWGHQHANGLSIARKTTGVNVNLLAADGPVKLEKVSGMAHLTGIPVTITKAKGKQAPTWSGL
jgi:formate dehydrogenase